MGFFDIDPMFFEKYEGGLPGADSNKDIQITFKTKECYVELEIVQLFGGPKFKIRPEQIVEVGLDQNMYRHAGKSLKGAIIGGVLTGGIGFLAGAAIGGKRRIENKLTLLININNFEHNVYIKPSKSTKELYKEFINFLSKFPKPPQIESPEIKQIEQQPPTIIQQVDVADQLEKLHSLMGKGIINKEEFEAHKKKLLT